MGRHAEVTRQWGILRALEASRTGKTIDELAELGTVCTRTIRRDLEALQEAGFALYDDRREDGKAIWKLETKPFRSLESSFTLAELAALYFSRALLESELHQPFQDALKGAFDRLDAALSPRMRQFLQQLRGVLTAKEARAAAGLANEDGDFVSRLTTAAIEKRKAVITYHSFSSRKVKQYEVEPYRLVYGDGSLYLFAFVPAYGQMRTFALKRIKKLTVLEETFEAAQQVPAQPFEHSMGINVGKPEHVEIEFAERVAPYIKERAWHRSQRIAARADGSIVLALEVCVDRALTSWILGFGPFARVIAPAALAEQILEEIEEAREVYVPRLFGEAESPGDWAEPRPQQVLPFTRRHAKRKPA